MTSPRLFFSAVNGLICTSVIAAAVAAEDAATIPPPADRKVDFVADVRPIFEKHCLDCHGPDLQENGFRLDRGKDALAGGDSGQVVVPGKSAESLLVKYVAGLDPDKTMPPDGERLSAEQIGLIRAWIDQGANWPKSADLTTDTRSDHWAYQPVVRPDVPASVADDAWVRNPIDGFVLARLREKGIEPSPEADRYTLIRRLSLDLLGLPPTPDEIDRFLNDYSAPGAYERLVDRTLQSPHFGERWGRHWLDKARYADSDGYEKDRPRMNAWRYRDWVIEAVNNDMPFDQFTIEQLAGDLLPDAGKDQILATAFHRQTLTNTEGGTDKEEFRVEAIFDRVETTGTVWLGLTVGCARCHSHKYDQITQREYYQLFAFFNNADEVKTDVPISDTAVARYQKQKAEHDAAVAQIRKKLTDAKEDLRPALAEWEKSLGDTKTGWTILEAASVESSAGVKFQKQQDGSYLATGKNPNQDTYTITVRTPMAGITGFRLEVLPDDRLPAKGPGRVAHGNFVLSEFKVAAGENGTAQPVKLTRAAADHEQKGKNGKPQWPAKATIDGKNDTGWAIAPEYGKPHTIVFETAEDLSAGKGDLKLTITLDQQYGKQHTIGRFRISATTDPRPVQLGLPQTIKAILAVAPPDRTSKQKRQLLDYYAGIDPEVSKLNRRLEELKQKAPKKPFMSVRVIGERSKNRRTTHLLRRGDFLQPTAEVRPDALEILHPLEPPAEGDRADRLDLARWLVSPENPLTARVAVNHVWDHLFGRPLVKTMDDFGVRGEKPTHPLLLDWLASEYVRLGWSRKALIKTIVMSSAYRQSSAHRPELAEVDPTNKLLYRQNRFRVEAEIVRDQYLAASGLLSRKVGGPSVFPPMPPDVAALSYANNFKWNESKGEDRYRRGMYTFFKRTAPHPNLTAFDCPDSNKTRVDRNTSNTPIQALTTMNNEVFIEAAQAMGKRLLDSEPAGDSDRIVHGFRLCVARPPGATEMQRFSDLLQASRRWYADHPEEAKELIGRHKAEGAAPEENAAWVVVARVMLNMDEFITRE